MRNHAACGSSRKGDTASRTTGGGSGRKGADPPKGRKPHAMHAICLAGVLLMLALPFSGCGSTQASEQAPSGKIETAAISSDAEAGAAGAANEEEKAGQETDKDTGKETSKDAEKETGRESRENDPETTPETESSQEQEQFNLEMVPAYSGEAYADINDDIPFFTEEELTDETFHEYWPLDELGRCTGAFACIGPELLPSEVRGNISTIEPSGWHSVRYDGIDGGYLYNRCHLIGYQLTGQDTNEKNLITGTRYMNLEGMLPFENSVRMYVEGTGNHVLYRVRPYYNGDDLLAAGVLMEAKSIEDPLVQFCAFCYNVQPGVEIDYATGDSHAQEAGSGEDEILPIMGGPETDGDESLTRSAEDETDPGEKEQDGPGDQEDGAALSRAEDDSDAEEPREITYILNTNTKKFHYPYCSSVKDMKEKNKRETTQSREEIIEQGYQPCKRCNP